MKKIFTLLFLLPVLFFGNSASAQEHARHEVAVYGLGGWSNMQYEQAGATVGTRQGIGFGADYTYFITPQWGVASGVEWQTFGATLENTTVGDVSKEVYSFGGDTEDMYFETRYNQYEESQSAAYLQIPLMLQFQTTSRHRFYAAAGAKMGFAVSGSYEAGALRLVTTGKLPATGQIFPAPGGAEMPNHGFLTIQRPSVSGDLNFGMHIALAAEAGMRWRLNDKMGLYTGLFFDYGLTDVSPDKTAASIVNYQNAKPSEFAYNSILAATRKTDGQFFVDKVTLLSVGIKVKVAFGL